MRWSRSNLNHGVAPICSLVQAPQYSLQIVAVNANAFAMGWRGISQFWKGK
jgi:hypothetical protein